MSGISTKLIKLSAQIACADNESAEALIILAQEDITEEDIAEALVGFLSNHPALVRLGMQDYTYIVGGAIRDLVLGKRPKDIDIVVDSQGLKKIDSIGKSPLDFGQAIARIVPGLNEDKVVEDNFFVVHVGPFPQDFFYDGVNLKGSKIEIVKARSEKYQKGMGYKPTEVKPGTLEDDVSRRDFTINTLAMSLSSASGGMENGDIIDLTGKGRDDLKKVLRDVNRNNQERSQRKSCLLRTPGDPYETFDEDPSRILRAIRFAFKYGCEIDGETRKAMSDKAVELNRIPWEPIGEVLIGKILSQSYAKEALVMMKGLGILDVIAEIVNNNKGFKTFLSRKIRELGIDQDKQLLLDLAGMGLDEIRTPASSLSVEQRRKVKKILPEHDDILGRVSRPPINMMDIAMRSGVGKGSVAKVKPVVQEILLDNPGLSNEEITELAVKKLEGIKAESMAKFPELRNIEDVQDKNSAVKKKINKVVDGQAYVAVFLTPESKKKLLGAFPPKHPRVFADHMTIAFGSDMKERMDELQPLIGKKVTVYTVGYAEDERGQAVQATTSPFVQSSNNKAHITISTEQRVPPVYSNNLLGRKNQDRYASITIEELEGIIDFYPRTIKEDDKGIVQGSTLYVFDFDDTLFWSPEWANSVHVDSSGFVTDAGDSFSVQSALNFISAVNKAPKKIFKDTYNIDKIPPKFLDMKLKKEAIDRPELGKENSFIFQVVGPSGEVITLEEMKMAFSSKQLKRAQIDARGKYIDFPAVTDDYMFYQTPSTLGLLGPNDEIFDLYKQHNDAVILTARQDKPGMKNGIIQMIKAHGGSAPQSVYLKPRGQASSGKYKAKALIELSAAPSVSKIVFYDDSLKYINSIKSELAKHDLANGTKLQDIIELNLVNKDNKPS